MPTILLIFGWRLYFYANEGNEPIHIHCQKGDMECKFWLDSDNSDVIEAFSYNMNSRDKREIIKIVYEYYEFIESEWEQFHKERSK